MPTWGTCTGPVGLSQLPALKDPPGSHPEPQICPEGVGASRPKLPSRHFGAVGTLIGGPWDGPLRKWVRKASSRPRCVSRAGEGSCSVHSSAPRYVPVLITSPSQVCALKDSVPVSRETGALGEWDSYSTDR